VVCGFVLWVCFLVEAVRVGLLCSAMSYFVFCIKVLLRVGFGVVVEFGGFWMFFVVFCCWWLVWG